MTSSSVFCAFLRSPIASCGLPMASRDARGVRFLAFGPGGWELALRGDRALVVALAGLRHADPVLGVRRERAVRVGDEKALHRRDRERVVAELELVERGLVGAHLAGLLRFGRLRPAWRLSLLLLLLL